VARPGPFQGSGHVWFFFNEAVPAALARKLGTHILTKTMECRPEVGLDSYDRLFPSQDTLPVGGFGNLIALPLQKRFRELGNSVFLDERFVPHSDQWKFLSLIRRIRRQEVEEIVHRADIKGQIIGVRLAPESEEDEDTPWKKPSRSRTKVSIIGPLPESLELILGNQIYVPKDVLPPALRNRLIRLAAFQNPEFYRLQGLRLPTYDRPRIIACAEDHAKHIGLPRGCLDEVRQTLSDLNIKALVRDERNPGLPLKATFQGELRPEQTVAAIAMLAHDTGVLAATTAFGKTVVAAWLIAQRGVNTLVLVHRRQLQLQWIERLSTFLGIPARTIGRIGGGRTKATGLLDVAVMQSLVRSGLVDDLVSNYGHLIVDECHHLSAQSFEQVARQARAKFVTGLSATVTRKDGQHPIIFMECGAVRYRDNVRHAVATHPFEHKVVVRATGFRPLRPADPDVRVQFHTLYEELIADEARNQLICQDVIHALREGRSPLVLTERNEHLDSLTKQLTSEVPHLIVLRGGMRKRELDATQARLAAIPTDEARLLLATGRYVGEGFDDARLDTLFLTLPVSWQGTITQYVGRLHRLFHNKREVRVYDYADLNVPMLARMFDRRCRRYEGIGYTIQLPGSAVPGWPAEVLLPVDPDWKSQYATSVRRLVRDGVDSPLAMLFVHAAVVPPSDADRPARARSATEAFLFRRLETLAETAGRFRLNAELPIPFDGWGRMEVDLLCEPSHIAIELDGRQHLGDAEAFRRDRRKDTLLQENGYRVLRFLAEDVGKCLDQVLDAILRALAHQNVRI
ncbi:MAG: restriction endonuclease subunit R, partial [Acidobacteria bacterium 13_2_20CM_56_17]